MPYFGSYNILVKRPEWEVTEHSWENRKDAVVSNIVQYMDVVGVQEFSGDQGKFLKEELFKSGWDGYLPELDVSLPFLGEFHHRVPIFWRKGLFTFVKSGVFQLSGFTVVEQYQTPIVEDRFCSWVVLFDGLRNVTVCNLHQQHSTVDASPVEVSMAIRKQNDGLNMVSSWLGQWDEPVVVLGDFNNVHVPEWFSGVSGLKNVWNVVGEEGKKNFQFNSFHEWAVPLPQLGEHSDQIFVTDRVNVKEVQVVLSDASDHFPIVASLELQ